MVKFHCVTSRYMYQSRHNQKYHWASNNEKQFPFWNVLLEQTQLLNLCKKQYSYSTILNIKINFFSPSTMMIIHSWAIMWLLFIFVIHWYVYLFWKRCVVFGVFIYLSLISISMEYLQMELFPFYKINNSFKFYITCLFL